MAENKQDIISISQQSSLLECCMCGDSGLTRELFQCKICHFRSQHSNLYPKAEFYRVCNWCLDQKEDSKDQRSQNSSNSSATWKDKIEEDDSNKKNKKNKKKTENDNNHGGMKGGGQRSKDLRLRVTKRSPSPEKSPRRRIISNARLEEKLRRTKSEERSNGGFITRHVFRNKVRRYKLLDEVSS
ncbi:uncharacterized protein LOC120153596 isoform X2 [Hibiscus syriacus]|uniref:uncharacterized protein LOC120153596 isoform X2 n=1 Tax=Hibiscus syriacus TaxID=106335 RepID=UPI001921AC6A|nr:uncharacterized protein LOC120153596 isoform X2 [Hibiscus syriacus]